jgi:hypothetical protein
MTVENQDNLFEATAEESGLTFTEGGKDGGDQTQLSGDAQFIDEEPFESGFPEDNLEPPKKEGEAATTEGEPENPEPPKEVEPEGEPESQPEGTETESEGYQPNFEYTVMDEKKQIPEKFRGLITDEDSEKEIRDIFERADGIESVKTSRDDFKTRAESAETQHNELVERWNKVARGFDEITYYRENNLRAFFKQFQFSEKEIMDYAESLIDAESDSNLKNRLDDDERRARDTFKSNVQTQDLQEQNVSQSRELHQQAMQAALARPDVSTFQREWDTRTGKPGAFLQAVNDYGSSVYHNEGRAINAYEAVDYVYGILSKGAVGQQQTEAASAATTTSQQATERPQTIPNVGPGRSVSPTKTRPRTLEEYRAKCDRRLAELQGE